MTPGVPNETVTETNMDFVRRREQYGFGMQILTIADPFSNTKSCLSANLPNV